MDWSSILFPRVQVCSSFMYKRVVLLFLFHRSLEPADCCYPPKRFFAHYGMQEQINPSIVREGSAHPSGAKRWCISESLRKQVYPEWSTLLFTFIASWMSTQVFFCFVQSSGYCVPLSYKAHYALGRLFPSKNRIPRPTLLESYLRRQNPEGNSES